MSDVLRMIENILWSFAVVGICYVIKCLSRASLLHYNLKMILINMSIGLLGYGCSRLATNTDSITCYFHIKQQNVIYRTSMLITKIYFVASLFIMMFCFLMLTVERTVATFVPERYEQMKKTGKGFCVFVLFWAISFVASIMLNLFWQMINPPRMDDDPLGSSFLLNTNTEFMLVIVYAAIAVNGANGVLVCFLYSHNKKRRIQLDRSKLNVRYQYSENIATTRLLLALTGNCFAAACVAAMLISFYYAARRKGLMSDPDLMFIEKSFHVLASIYAIFYNIVFLAMHRPNRDQLVRDVRRLTCSQRQTSVVSLRSQVKSIEGHRLSFKNEGTVYFNYLSQQWNAKQ
uniref:G_PROTEIN_RECEP_F1_2 domain-containing protein n=1 Tax=Steinernema glaseri TaxID=37863 RepID=A0A1I8ACY8_9BILA